MIFCPTTKWRPSSGFSASTGTEFQGTCCSSALRFAFDTVPLSATLVTIALAFFTVAASALPVAVAWAGKRIVDAVVVSQRDEALFWVLVELGLVAGLALSGRGLGLLRSVLGARLALDINVLILEKAAKLTELIDKAPK